MSSGFFECIRDMDGILPTVRVSGARSLIITNVDELLIRG